VIIIKKLLNKIKKKITTELFIADSLFLVGTLILVITNFYMSIIFGAYSVSACLITYSLFLNKSHKEVKKK